VTETPEDEPRTSEARKDAILRAALDCVVIVDHEGQVTELNPATEETFGWTRSEAIGQPFLELTIAAEHRAELAAVLETGSGPLLGAGLEVNAIRADLRLSESQKQALLSVYRSFLSTEPTNGAGTTTTTPPKERKTAAS